jgi:2'-5' RNA ligase
VSFFLAVDLDEPVREEAWRAVERERPHASDAKWLRRDKLHVTLAFLGEPSLEVRAGLEARVRGLVERLPSFSLHLGGAGQFETARAPAVLWLGVGGELGPLRAVQHALSVGLQVELDRPYVPHLTLARGKRVDALAGVRAALEAFRSAAFVVDHVTFYESTHEKYAAHFQVPLLDSGR